MKYQSGQIRRNFTSSSIRKPQISSAQSSVVLELKTERDMPKSKSAASTVIAIVVLGLVTIFIYMLLQSKLWALSKEQSDLEYEIARNEEIIENLESEISYNNHNLELLVKKYGLIQPENYWDLNLND